MTAFALLDDCDASPLQPSSRLYTGFLHEHRCEDPLTLDGVCDAAQAELQAGRHVLLLADYEWGAKLQRAGHGHLPADDRSALRLLVFGALQRLSRNEADAWLALQAAEDTAPSAAGLLPMRESVTAAGFEAAIEAIRQAISEGQTYQVNHTYRLHGAACGSPLALYRRLRARQPVRYGAFIALPPDAPGPRHVLSCSPELFLQHDNGLLTARPMKGTAPRDPMGGDDSGTAAWLAQDVKNRAENLMIVDLLRNDIGRIARTGSVRVPALFAVEAHDTVFQMTSTVQAELLPDQSLADVLRASFPCGSITGAPKHRTMQLIAGLEDSPRGLYTGAIGWIDAAPAGRRCGDFCLSVPIRTLLLDAPDASGLRAAQLGVGAGIVLDSVAADEHAECRLKARFATGLQPEFGLFETVHATRRDGVRHRALHLARLAASAAALGFAWDVAAVATALDALLAALPDDAPRRVRLDLAADGRLQLTQALLAPLPPAEVLLRIERDPWPECPALGAHKTTLRAHYDAGVRRAEAAGAFDSLFFTADGRLVEGGRSSVFVRLDGRWCTPPVADGALPGIMRGLLMEQLGAQERTLWRTELGAAEAWTVCNALRGALPARLAQPLD